MHIFQMPQKGTHLQNCQGRFLLKDSLSSLLIMPNHTSNSSLQLSHFCFFLSICSITNLDDSPDLNRLVGNLPNHSFHYWYLLLFSLVLPIPLLDLHSMALFWSLHSSAHKPSKVPQLLSK